MLYDLSYPNLILLSATLPTYESHDKGASSTRPNQGEEIINADDPINRERVRKLLQNMG